MKVQDSVSISGNGPFGWKTAVRATLDLGFELRHACHRTTVPRTVQYDQEVWL